MKSAIFDQHGFDKESFSPFVLHNCLDTEWKDVRLSFDDWGLFQMIYGSDTVDGYYMNGYGVEGLVKAALFDNQIDPDGEGFNYDSEGDTCYIHFTTLELAIRVAHIASSMIKDKDHLMKAIKIARAEGFED